ncbi:MAG: PAS domain S-box protein [Thermodesulfobacteriota bacterium]
MTDQAPSGPAPRTRVGRLGSVRARILMLVLVLVVPALVLQCVYYYNLYHDQIRQELRSNLEVARALAEVFEQFVRNLQQHQATIAMVMSQYPGFTTDQKRAYLQASRGEFAAVLSMSWLSPQGEVLLSTTPGAEGRRLAPPANHPRPGQARGGILGNLYQDAETGDPVFDFWQPQGDGEGQPQGWVLAVISARKLEATLAFIRSEDGGLSLTDATGRLVFRAPSLPWKWEQRDWRRRFPEVLEPVLAGRERAMVLPQDHALVARVVAWVPAGATGWAAGAGRPLSQALGPFHRNLLLGGGLFILSLTVGLLLAAAIARRISHPLRQLRDWSLNLAQGQLPPAASPGGLNEVEDLARAFNHTADQLHQRQEQNRQERERAEALAEEMRALAQEFASLLGRMNAMIQASEQLLAETTSAGLMNRVVTAARQLTGARLGTAGHGHQNGVFKVGAISCAHDAQACPSGEDFKMERGGVYMELIKRPGSLRLSDQELRAHPAWRGLPPGHTPLRGLLGATLVDCEGQSNGLIMVSDKEDGGEFDAQDEALLVQLAALVSLGLQNIESLEQARARTAQVEEGSRILRAVMERIPGGLALVEMSAPRLTMISRHGLEILGVDEGFLALPWREQLAKVRLHEAELQPGDKPRKPPLTRAALEGEIVLNEEWMLERPDGGRLPLLVNAGPVRDDAGQITHVVITFSDITTIKAAQEVLRTSHQELEQRVRERTAELTLANQHLRQEVQERRLAEAALSKSEEKFRLLAENVEDAIWIAEPDLSRFTYASPALEKLCGCSRAELYSDPRRLLRDVAVQDRPRVHKVWRDPERLNWNLEYRLERDDGSQAWVQDRGFTILDDQGRIHSRAGLLTDITQRKQDEKALLAYQEQLRSLAAELHSAEERLRRRIARDLHDSLGQALAMSKLKLGALKTKAGCDAPALDDVISLIDKSIAGTRSLISELSPPVLYEMGLGEALEWLAERTEKQFGLQVDVELARLPKPIPVKLQALIYRLAAELVNNVIKHAQAGWMLISLTSAGHDLVLEVEDDGRGFSPQRESGGFGLFSIRERLRLLGGNLYLESQPGRGARATVSIPFEPDLADFGEDS